MKILTVGVNGTIGKPLTKLYLRVKEELDFEVIFHKDKPEQKRRAMLKRFRNDYGGKLAVYAKNLEEFKILLAPIGIQPDYTFEDAIKHVDVIADCTDKVVALELKEKYYRHLTDKMGFIAQGSVTGFGKPYAFGINDCALKPREDKFIQVVSCNTHQILSVLKTLAFDPHNTGHFDFGNLVRARFSLARRDSDISQENGKVGVVVGKPVHPYYGSHQAEDAIRVLQTINQNVVLNLDDIHAIANTFNNPFMHVVDFEIRLMERITEQEVENRFRLNPLTDVTYEDVSNMLFATGRDEGHFGRFLSQTVVCLPSIQVIDRTIFGCCFTPQDGNPLLSSMAATLWFRDPSTYQQKIKENFFKLPFIFDEV